MEHQGTRKLLQNYIANEKKLYADALAKNPQASIVYSKADKWFARIRKTWRFLHRKEVEIPATFFEPYPIAKEDFLPEGFDRQKLRKALVLSMVQVKYQLRGYNILREFSRCVEFFPEILENDVRYKILELSSGSCALAEICDHFGNTFQATDYLSGRGSVYKILHDALNLNVIEFDGSKLPYNFDDNSFDIIVCYQAIDAYGGVDKYSSFILEMLRVARKKVVIVFNAASRQTTPFSQEELEKQLQQFLEEPYLEVEFSKCPSTNLPSAVFNLVSSNEAN